MKIGRNIKIEKIKKLIYLLYLILIIFAVAPSIIWLLFFLRKDTHPESNQMIILVFLLGIAIVPLGFLAECIPIGIDKLGNISCFLPSFLGEIFSFLPPILGSFLAALLGVALIEEVIKYLVVRWKVLKNPEFDEPLDVMLYMIIAALGFAAFENFLYLLPSPETPLTHEFITVNFLPLMGLVAFISFFRFVGAVFLHALCSGTIGYFLARSFFEPKNKLKLLFAGFSIAILLHSVFNLSIMKIEESLILAGGQVYLKNPITFYLSLGIVVFTLIGLAVFVTLGFRNLKKIISVCKINPRNVRHET